MEKRLYLALLHKLGISQKYLNIIFENNTDYKKFYDELSRESFVGLNIRKSQIDFILQSKREVTLDYIKLKIKERNVSIVVCGDDNYPDLLNEIPNSPYLFYLRGNIDNLPKISVVGSRKMTSYGSNVTTKIVGDISKYFTVVSGGAAGCDTKAHRIAMDNGNKTISVIGTGIDVDYPVYNSKIYDEMVSKGGGIVSVFPIGEPGNPYNFPIRNEIVAGLSLGVLVIEAMKKSGTLITAKLALDLGKDLFAIPGDVNKTSSAGCNMLIKRSMAKLVEHSNDIFEDFNVSLKKSQTNDKKIVFTDKNEEKIYNLLLLEKYSIDELSREISLDTSLLSQKISFMEINNLIKKGLGGKYEVF